MWSLVITINMHLICVKRDNSIQLERRKKETFTFKKKSSLRINHTDI